MYKKAVAQEAWHYAGAALVLKSYGFLLMADMFGEMPYFEANSDSTYPKYDTGETIYTECLKNLDEAIEDFGKTQPLTVAKLSAGDSWNNGDVNKWKCMAYLLKARTINQMSKKSQYYDADAILAALDNAQQSINDDTYIVHYDVKETSKDFISTDPLQSNTLWNQTYNSGADQTRITKWLYDILTSFDGKGIEDPRANKIIPFGQIGVDANGNRIWLRSQGYEMREGYTNVGRTDNSPYRYTTREADGSKWIVADASHEADTVYIPLRSGSYGVYESRSTGVLWTGTGDSRYALSSGNVYLRPDSPLLWSTYAEACFIRAEVLMRRGDKTGAFNAYKAGIKANIDELNKALTENWTDEMYKDCPSFGAMSQSDIDNFLNNAIGTSNDITMEKIMTQKFIALLYRSQNWDDMRRHDYKDYMGWAQPFEHSVNAGSLKSIPQGKVWRRIKPSSHEINYNFDNLYESNPHFSDDDVYTQPVWWDTEE
jgi:hypothetical protein